MTHLISRAIMYAIWSPIMAACWVLDVLYPIED